MRCNLVHVVGQAGVLANDHLSQATPLPRAISLLAWLGLAWLGLVPVVVDALVVNVYFISYIPLIRYDVHQGRKRLRLQCGYVPGSSLCPVLRLRAKRPKVPNRSRTAAPGRDAARVCSSRDARRCGWIGASASVHCLDSRRNLGTTGGQDGRWCSKVKARPPSAISKKVA